MSTDVVIRAWQWNESVWLLSLDTWKPHPGYQPTTATFSTWGASRWIESPGPEPHRPVPGCGDARWTTARCRPTPGGCWGDQRRTLLCRPGAGHRSTWCGLSASLLGRQYHGENSPQRTSLKTKFNKNAVFCITSRIICSYLADIMAALRKLSILFTERN